MRTFGVGPWRSLRAFADFVLAAEDATPPFIGCGCDLCFRRDQLILDTRHDDYWSI